MRREFLPEEVGGTSVITFLRSWLGEGEKDNRRRQFYLYSQKRLSGGGERGSREATAAEVRVERKGK